MFLPDTNAWIRFLNPGENQVKERLDALHVDSIFVCAVVKAELYYGAMKSRQRKDNLALLSDVFRRIRSLPFDDLAAYHCGEVRAALDRAGRPIGPYDLQIAAIALAHDLTVVTHNTDEFARVPGLKLEDWEA